MMATCMTSLLQLASESIEVGRIKHPGGPRWLKQMRWQSIEVATSLGQEGGGDKWGTGGGGGGAQDPVRFDQNYNASS